MINMYRMIYNMFKMINMYEQFCDISSFVFFFICSWNYRCSSRKCDGPRCWRDWIKCEYSLQFSFFISSYTFITQTVHVHNRSPRSGQKVPGQVKNPRSGLKVPGQVIVPRLVKCFRSGQVFQCQIVCQVVKVSLPSVLGHMCFWSGIVSPGWSWVPDQSKWPLAGQVKCSRWGQVIQTQSHIHHNFIIVDISLITIR